MQYNSKKSISAPCLYVGKSNKGKREDFYPGTACTLQCASCGWNPAEKQRRLEQGRWEEVEITHELHDDPGTTVIETITKVCRKLIFPPKEEPTC